MAIIIGNCWHAAAPQLQSLNAMAMKASEFLPLVYAFLAYLVIKLSLKYLGRQRPLPPSPRADPVIGHARYISADFSWITFAEWGKKWGEYWLVCLMCMCWRYSLGGIIYLHLFGRPLIVLNDLKIARELLDKRGSIYSDRPRFVFHSEMYATSTAYFFPLRYSHFYFNF